MSQLLDAVNDVNSKVDVLIASSTTKDGTIKTQADTIAAQQARITELESSAGDVPAAITALGELSTKLEAANAPPPPPPPPV